MNKYAFIGIFHRKGNKITTALFTLSACNDIKSISVPGANNFS